MGLLGRRRLRRRSGRCLPCLELLHVRFDLFGVAQICLLHRWIAPHLLGRTASDDLAEIQHVHRVADTQHQLGVVLDQNDGAALGGERSEEMAEGLGLALVEA